MNWIVLLSLLCLLLHITVADAFQSFPKRHCHSRSSYGRPRHHKYKKGIPHHWTSTTAHATETLVVSSATSAVTVLSPLVAGGLLSGALHAITGPDHIAALLPSSLGKSTLVGVKNGAMWGVGHGISATFLGFCAFFLKDKISSKFFDLAKLTSFAETAVGVSLILIGLLGVKESLEKSDPEEHTTSSSIPTSSTSADTSSRSLFLNGLLHGFSLDGAPSIAPAVVMSSWQNAAFYLICYSLGTTVAMSLASATIAALSSRLGKMANVPDLPKKLSLISSAVALLIGIYWVVHPLVMRAL